jgi:xylulokinase
MPGYVIGVDCSTTATKAVVFDAAGTAVAEGRRSFPLSRPRPGWHEQDARTWRESTFGALADAVSQVDATDVLAIGLTHQRESFVCLDERGWAIRPAILWLDGRAGPQIREHGSAAVHELSGKPPDVTPALYKLLWLRENEPQTLERAAMVTDVHGYLVHALTGQWRTSVASADPLGLVDMSTGAWSEQLLGMVGLTLGQLPEVVAPGTVVGELTDEAARATGLRAGVRVVAGAGDGQSAGLGADVTVAGRAYLNLGTAVAAGTHSDTYRWDRAFRTMFSPVPGAYTLETLLSGGTYIVSWYVERFGSIPELGLGLSAEQVLETAAAQLPRGSDGLMLLPYWNAAQTPYWDPAARGVVLGWQGMHGKAHLYRAALEGIAYELRLQTDGVDAVLGSPVERFYAMGGGSRSPLWSQLVADITGRPVTLCRETETTALGAAILAAAAVDLHGSGAPGRASAPAATPDAIRAAADAMTGFARTVHPDPVAAAVYDRFFDVYRDLYPRLADLFPRLAEATRLADGQG